MVDESEAVVERACGLVRRVDAEHDVPTAFVTQRRGNGAHQRPPDPAPARRRTSVEPEDEAEVRAAEVRVDRADSLTVLLRDERDVIRQQRRLERRDVVMTVPEERRSCAPESRL